MTIALCGWFALSNPSSPAGVSAATRPGTTVGYGGRSWNLLGVNAAWYNWACDFGCGGNGGVSSAKGAIGARFAGLQQSNVHNVRWWMFEGNGWQIQTDSSGKPTRVNPAVYADIDAALELARQYDLYYTFVIFNFPGDIPSAWLNDASSRTALANALGPLFERYKDEPRLFSWEVFNEPEWDMWNNKVSTPNTQALVREIVRSVKANSSTYVTVGSAMVDGLSFWTGMGLDYYQAHWYDYMQPGNWCAYCRSYDDVRTQYGLDGPLVIGEFFSGTGQQAIDRWETFYSKGYAGAWAWSLFPERTSDRMAVDLAAAATFASRHPGVIGPTGGTASLPQQPPATSTPTVTPTATATKTATATASATTPATSSPAPSATTPAARVPSSWVTTATVSSASVARGSTITATAKVQAPTAGAFLFDVEIYSPSGQKTTQRYWDNTAFTAGQERTRSLSWTVPSNAEAGTWVVKIGIFSPSWQSMVSWDNDTGGSFRVY